MEFGDESQAIRQRQTSTARLYAISSGTSTLVTFELRFSTSAILTEEHCAPAELHLGDGQSIDLGVLCSPTNDTWRTQRSRVLAEHVYRDDTHEPARLLWGNQEMVAIPQEPDSGEVGNKSTVDVELFAIWTSDEDPLNVVVELNVAGIPQDQRLRIDGGAGNLRWLRPIDRPVERSAQQAEWQFSYSKPGSYMVSVDLLDADGFWVDTVAGIPLEIAEPVEKSTDDIDGDGTDEDQASNDGSLQTSIIASPVSELHEIAQTDADTPWLPFRYVRPMWAWARTYTHAGGSVISRYLALGTYLAVRQEVIVGGDLWYQTGGYDWIPASSVSALTISALRGVDSGGDAPDPGPGPGPEPGEERQGLVTADVLNVRRGPGTNHPVVEQLRYNTQVTIYEETDYAGATWYRIGTDRWVHSGWIRLIDSPPKPEPKPTRQGVVTADVLNVRDRPGVRSDNPPIDRLLKGARVTIHEEATDNGAIWYRIGVDSWVHSGWVQLVADAENLPARQTEDATAQLPVGWVATSSLNVRATPGISAESSVIGAVYHNQSLAILDSAVMDGQTWYRIGEDQWVYGANIRVARLRARPASIGSDERWVGVNLRTQTAVAYEGDTPVYAAMVATGLPGTPTVQGVFRTWWRLVSRKMSGGSAATGGYYFLEEVPWTCYFYSGYALHAAYWHDAFGNPRSHGCVNISPYDAWWIFQWSEAGGANSPAVYVYWA